jgi:hypothetical protein
MAFFDNLREIIMGPETSGLTHNPSTLQSSLGMALWGAGLIGSIDQLGKMKTYDQATKSSQGMVGALANDYNKDIAGIDSTLQTDLGKNFSGVKSQIVSSMNARGLTDASQQAASVNQYGASLSGAYAAAAEALAKAKVNALDALAGTQSYYFQNVARQQFQSMLNKRKADAGIWGALGGMGAGVLADVLPDGSNPPAKPVDPNGVSDSNPARTIADERFRATPATPAAAPSVPSRPTPDFNPFGVR